ncbi:ankyrin repeat-containing domain protein, partial [Lasiosphaeris hirsuta]
ACRSENQALAELLVAHGARVDVHDADAGTPLSIAVDAGSPKMAAFVISQPGGKELMSIPDGRGFLPLHNTLYSDACLELSALLISAGAPADTPISSDLARDNKRGLTLLMLACDLGSDRNPLVHPLVTSLLSAGADPNKTAALGQNALILSVLARDLPVIKLLAARGADIKAMNESSDNPAKPLHAAAIAGHPELCRWLVTEAGCAVGERDGDGYSALIHAAGYAAGDSAETVAALAELGGEVEGPTRDGRRPLHFAAFKGQARCAAELIRRGADVEAEDEHGWTPLHFAGRYHHRNVAEVLLESG